MTWKERFFALWRDEGAADRPEAFDPVFYRADDALVDAIPVTLSFDETVRRLTANIAAGLAVRDERVIARVADRFLDDAHRHLRRNQRAARAARRALPARSRVQLLWEPRHRVS